MIAKNGKEVMSVYKNGKLLNSVWAGNKQVWPTWKAVDFFTWANYWDPNAGWPKDKKEWQEYYDSHIFKDAIVDLDPPKLFDNLSWSIEQGATGSITTTVTSGNGGFSLHSVATEDVHWDHWYDGERLAIVKSDEFQITVGRLVFGLSKNTFKNHTDMWGVRTGVTVSTYLCYYLPDGSVKETWGSGPSIRDGFKPQEKITCFLRVYVNWFDGSHGYSAGKEWDGEVSGYARQYAEYRVLQEATPMLKPSQIKGALGVLDNSKRNELMKKYFPVVDGKVEYGKSVSSNGIMFWPRDYQHAKRQILYDNHSVYLKFTDKDGKYDLVEGQILSQSAGTPGSYSIDLLNKSGQTPTGHDVSMTFNIQYVGVLNWIERNENPDYYTQMIYLVK